MLSTQIGGGPILIHAPVRDVRTWGNFGSLRMIAYQERLDLIAGLELSTWRLNALATTTLPADMQGNELCFVLGYYKSPWAVWGGLGGGQIRVADREPKDLNNPHRFLLQTISFSGSYDLYQAEFGKIDTSLTWRRMEPEQNWKTRYALSFIEALQFEIGFKLLSW